jgi:guanyl-specific ribonuclease Sa
VHKGRDGAPQSFVSEYTVEYELAKERGAGWVITGAVVQME